MQVPLLVALLAYLLAGLLTGPIRDISQATGGVIKGFGALLYESTTFVFGVLKGVASETGEL